MKNGLGDMDRLRQMVFDYMLSNEINRYEMARRIGIEYRTMKAFMEDKRQSRFASVAKIINFFKAQDKMYNNVNWDKEGSA